MDILTTGLIVLLIMTAIVYVVLFSFLYYWHIKSLTYIVVPAIFTFEFFIIGFLVVCITALILNYLPEVAKILGQ
jgi:hypothetical protein